MSFKPQGVGSIPARVRPVAKPKSYFVQIMTICKHLPTLVFVRIQVALKSGFVFCVLWTECNTNIVCWLNLGHRTVILYFNPENVFVENVTK